MYNEELENLIDAALADGVLTEKEKQVLFKKAQALGVDLDEFEMVLDARLVKLQKSEAEKAASSAPKSNKLGDVKKCPACGAMVQSYQGQCPECGYAFEGIDANMSSQKLAQKIEQINSAYDDRVAKAGDNVSDDKWQEKKNKIEALAQAVRTFPVPTTKSDLFEFITTMQSSMLSPSTPYTMADAYMSKYTECIIKAKALFPNDPIIATLLSDQQNVKREYVKIHKRQPKIGLKTGTKMAITLLSMFIGGIAIMVILGVLGVFE